MINNKIKRKFIKNVIIIFKKILHQKEIFKKKQYKNKE